MRRGSFLIAALFLAGARLAFADEITAQSRLTQATVYLDSALLTRTADLEVSAGEHRIVFPDIIPNLDENTLRVSGAGSAKVKIFGAQFKKEFLKEKPAEKVQELEKAIEDLGIEKRKLEDNHNILMQEREFLASLRYHSQGQLPKDLVTKVPSVKDIADLLNLLDANLKDNFARVLDVEIKIREVNKNIEVLRKKLAEIATTGMLKRFIVVEVQVLKAGSLKLELSYLVRGASWHPVYDARASFEKAEVELVSYGMVKQTTGEDWTDVDVTLSTSRPSIGGRMPYVAPWFLRVFTPQPSAPRRMYKAEGKMALSQFAVMDKDVMLETVGGIGGPAEEEAEEVYAASQEKGTGVIYKIARKSTVKSDGTEYKLPIGAQALRSEFKYAAYLRASEYAYLRTTVVNTDQMQLPAGAVHVFLEGDFVGRSSIDNIGPGEKFDLYLGVDENVKVKRELVEKKTDDVLVGGIPSPSMKLTFTYKVLLENYKTKNIEVYLFESMPVSEDERIKVKVLSVKPEPKEKDWEKRKGVWRWEIELKPREKKEVFYTFMIEYPRNLQVEGL